MAPVSLLSHDDKDRMRRRAINTHLVGVHVPPTVGETPLWSHGQRVGEFVITAGQPGVTSSGRIAVGDVREQTRQSLENIKTILEEENFAFLHVAKIRAFITQASHYRTVESEQIAFYKKHFPTGALPAITTLLTGPLVSDQLLVEIEAIAYANREVFDLPGTTADSVPRAEGSLNAPAGADCGQVLFTSCQSGSKVGVGTASLDAANQASHAINLVRSIVESRGLASTDIVKLNTYVGSMNDCEATVDALNELLHDWLPKGQYPAHTIMVTDLLSGARVEVEAIAARGEKAHAPCASSQPVGPHRSDTVRSGDWVFLSQQTGHRHDGTIPSDATAQASQMLANTERALERAGAQFNDIVQATIWLRTTEIYPALNDARRPFYQDRVEADDLPASSAVVGASPHGDVLMVLEATAYVRPGG